MDYVGSGRIICSGIAETEHPAIVTPAGDPQAFLSRSLKYNFIQPLRWKESDPYFNTRFLFSYSDPLSGTFEGNAIVGYIPGLAYGDTQVYWGAPEPFSPSDTKNISSASTLYNNFVIYYARDDGLAYSRLGYVEGLNISFLDEVVENDPAEIIEASSLDGKFIAVATATVNEHGYSIAAHIDRVTSLDLNHYSSTLVYSKKYRWPPKSRKDIQLRVVTIDDTHFTILHVPPYNIAGSLIAIDCEMLYSNVVKVINIQEVSLIYGSAESDYDLRVSGAGSSTQSKIAIAYMDTESNGKITLLGPLNYRKNIEFFDSYYKSNLLAKKSDYSFSLLITDSLYRKNLYLDSELLSVIKADYAYPAFSSFGAHLSNDFGDPQYLLEVFSDSTGCYFIAQAYPLEYEAVPSYFRLSGAAEGIELELIYIASGSMAMAGSAEYGYTITYLYEGSGSLISSGSADATIELEYEASGSILISGESDTTIEFEFDASGSIITNGSADTEMSDPVYLYDASGTIIISGAAVIPAEDSGLLGDVFYGDTYYRES